MYVYVWYWLGWYCLVMFVICDKNGDMKDLSVWLFLVRIMLVCFIYCGLNIWCYWWLLIGVLVGRFFVMWGLWCLWMVGIIWCVVKMCLWCCGIWRFFCCGKCCNFWEICCWWFCLCLICLSIFDIVGFCSYILVWLFWVRCYCCCVVILLLWLMLL